MWACVGDSLTQLTYYPNDLKQMLGSDYTRVRNFGVGSTTVSLESETPYMNTSKFQDALEFNPDIVSPHAGNQRRPTQPSPVQRQFCGQHLTLVCRIPSASQ